MATFSIYNSAGHYNVGDLVYDKLSGLIYLCRKETIGNPLTDTDTWVDFRINVRRGDNIDKDGKLNPVDTSAFSINEGGDIVWTLDPWNPIVFTKNALYTLLDQYFRLKDSLELAYFEYGELNVFDLPWGVTKVVIYERSGLISVMDVSDKINEVANKLNPDWSDGYVAGDINGYIICR